MYSSDPAFKPPAPNSLSAASIAAPISTGLGVLLIFNMKFIFALATLLAFVVGYDVTVLKPPASAAETATSIAVIWINGALSDPLSYVKLAQEF